MYSNIKPMLAPKATFHSQEYMDMRCTDLGQLAKKLKACLNKVIHACTHNNQSMVRHNNLYMASPKANIQQTGVTQHEVPVHTHIHASAMHTDPKLCPSFVSTAQDTKGYSYDTNK